MISQLQQEAQEELERTLRKRQLKKESERQVNSHNEQQMLGKQNLRRFEKVQDVNAFQDYKNLVDGDEEKRARERNARQDHIKALLNRQPVVTVEHSVVN
jgi:hypothetical protein